MLTFLRMLALAVALTFVVTSSTSMAGITAVSALEAPAPFAPETSAISADTARANTVLKDLMSTYRYLDGVSVTVGPTPNGHQAVSYYTHGSIILSPTHEASVDAILEHEIWHVIDWRDNGRIDWDEDLPPGNSADYLK